MTEPRQKDGTRPGAWVPRPETGRCAPKSAAAPTDEEPRPSRRTVMQLDLRGVRCPLSWAKAKVQLEGLLRGDELRLLLDDRKGVRDIPRAAEAAGYTVAEPLSQHGGCWQITIVV